MEQKSTLPPKSHSQKRLECSMVGSRDRNHWHFPQSCWAPKGGWVCVRACVCARVLACVQKYILKQLITPRVDMRRRYHSKILELLKTSDSWSNRKDNNFASRKADTDISVKSFTTFRPPLYLRSFESLFCEECPFKGQMKERSITNEQAANFDVLVPNFLDTRRPVCL